MKCVITLLNASMAIFVVLITPFSTLAQIKDVKKLAQLENLLNRARNPKAEDVPFVTSYILDSLIVSYQKTISGSQVEAGKVIGSSISITDKGATTNIGIKRFGPVYSQVSITGQGKDNLINLFEDGSYGNTLGAGLKFQVFQSSSGFFSRKNANILHNKLLLLRHKKGIYPGAVPTTEYDAKLTYIFMQINNLTKYKDVYNAAQEAVGPIADTNRQKVEDYLTAADTLTKLSLLTKYFLYEDSTTRRYEVDLLKSRWDTATVGDGPDDLRLRYYLSEAEAIQISAPWNALSFKWFTFAFNYNVTPYKVLDTLAEDKNYQRTDNDYFFSSSVSWNYLRARQQFNQRRFFTSPTITIGGARVYKDEDKMTLDRLKPYIIGTDTLHHKDMTADLYNKVAERKLVASFEVPLIWYWYKRSFGLEISPKVGVNDPKEDNVGLRVGFFIPAEIKDGAPIIVQPYFRMQKLFAGGNMDFWKDNVAIGFNVSVSLPKALGKM